MAENPDAMDWTRHALAQLTARVSDLEGESEGLAREVFAMQVAGDDVDVDAPMHLSIGMENLAVKLVIELARAKGVEPAGVCQVLAGWLTSVE